MSEIASYSEIVAYLRTQPAASVAWAEGFFAAGLSMAAVITVIQTMSSDMESPLKEAQEGVMKGEIVRLNLARGGGNVGKATAVKHVVYIRAVLSAVERTRVIQAVSGFCQPVFESKGHFGRNGHAVMNAVRRACAAHISARLPLDASIIEVGPDVKNCLMSPTYSSWVNTSGGSYVGARPVMVPRDVARTDWTRLAAAIKKVGTSGFSQAVVDSAKNLELHWDELFPDVRIQDLKRPGEYITSYDSNYDIAFADMPKSMALCGARAWYGCMVRAKGLTTRTRLVSGSLALLGVNFRVDWQASRIDFRHPECSAFGYSHNVWEYMKYEENNGFVWTNQHCHFVYSKAPETTDELLFFSVVRVPNALRIREPKYVEHACARQVKITSVWSNGDETNGVPTSFSPIVFHVDKLNFSKVLEKRRALDHQGDLGVTINIVRSTNVRFWLNGTPIGASERIQSRLAEATAVVVETVVAAKRREANMTFGKAMYEFDASVQKDGFILRILSSVLDVRAVTGTVAKPIVRMWQGMRGALLDTALSSIGKLSVGYEEVAEHVPLGLEKEESLDVSVVWGTGSGCKCLEIAECNAALMMAEDCERKELQIYIEGLRKLGSGCKCKQSALSEESIGKLVEDDEIVGDVMESVLSEETAVDSEDEASKDDIVSVDTSKCWNDVEYSGMIEYKAMDEFKRLEVYLQVCLESEIKTDYARILDEGRVTDNLLKQMSTARTSHSMIRFMSGRAVERIGVDFGAYSAVYDHGSQRIVKVKVVGSAVSCRLDDGWYYTCNKLDVWNFEEIHAATNYALTYGLVRSFRKSYEVTIGVPGAGKTYTMMKRLSVEFAETGCSFFVLSATKAAVKAAIGFGCNFGMSKKLLEARIMTADKYLMHNKKSAELLCVDEFSAMHLGKIDVLATLTAAKKIRLYGDAKQVSYNPFSAEFRMMFNKVEDSVPTSQVTFLPKTHRLGAQMCALWIDQYPTIYPCECCTTYEKENMSIKLRRIDNLSQLSFEKDVRYHTFKQDEKEELRQHLGYAESPEVLRAMEVGGMATVHEDQGSTHKNLKTVRLHVEYDKNASEKNPSLHNKKDYALSDMTRAVETYEYITMCPEVDEICKRIAMVGDEERLRCVREKISYSNVTVADLLY